MRRRGTGGGSDPAPCRAIGRTAKMRPLSRNEERMMNRLSMIALVAGLTGLASAAMAQQTNQPPPPAGPYQAGPWGPGYGQQPAPQGQAQAEAPKATAPAQG